MGSPSDWRRSERVLWSGVPKQGFVLRESDIWTIPFSLFWGGFVAFALHDAITKPDRGPGTFFLIPFAAVGVWLLLGRFFYDIWRRRRTRYAVTSDQAIIEMQGPFPSRHSIDLRTATDITLTEHRDGTGTIEFGRPVRQGRQVHTPPQFEMIPNAKAVYDLVRSRVPTR